MDDSDVEKEDYIRKVGFIEKGDLNTCIKAQRKKEEHIENPE